MTNTLAVAAPTGLPRGRHALSRTEVLATQRRRLLRAMTDEVAERGYAATTAAGVYSRAKVSSRAFYENFRDVNDCFLAAYEQCIQVTGQTLRASSESAGLTPLDRFDAMLSAYLQLLTDEPAMARTFLLEVYAAGSLARHQRLEVHQRFVATARQLLAPERELAEQDEAALEGLISAITFQVTIRTAVGDLGDLDALRRDLLVLTQRLCTWLDT